MNWMNLMNFDTNRSSWKLSAAYDSWSVFISVQGSVQKRPRSPTLRTLWIVPGYPLPVLHERRSCLRSIKLRNWPFETLYTSQSASHSFPDRQENMIKPNRASDVIKTTLKRDTPFTDLQASVRSCTLEVALIWVSWVPLSKLLEATVLEAVPFSPLLWFKEKPFLSARLNALRSRALLICYTVATAIGLLRVSEWGCFECEHF